MKHYVTASLMRPDENLGDGTSTKSEPTAGGVTHILCPEGTSGAAFDVLPPDNWNGYVDATIYANCIDDVSGSTKVFVAAEVIKSGSQYQLPENAEKQEAVISFTGSMTGQHGRACVGQITVDGPSWSPGDVLTLWVGRNATDNTLGSAIGITGVALQFDQTLK